ncbi:hypothetical protein BDR05DRAFT_964428 [Suillus weaverae]|nr:hypothetical protein BDR05DRAFT_964428 [Suillus weaverae]
MTYAVAGSMFHVHELSSRLSPTTAYTSVIYQSLFIILLIINLAVPCSVERSSQCTPPSTWARTVQCFTVTTQVWHHSDPILSSSLLLSLLRSTLDCI